VNPETFDNLWKNNRKNSLYADDLLLIARTFGVSMEELLTGESAPKEQVVFDDPITAELWNMIEQLDHEQMLELRGAVGMYLQIRFAESDRMGAERDPTYSTPRGSAS
jgi:hypothetical protein